MRLLSLNSTSARAHTGLGLLAAIVLMACPVIAGEKLPPDQATLTAAKGVIEASGGRNDAFKAMIGMKEGYIAQVRGKDPTVADKLDHALAPLVEENSTCMQTTLDEMEAVALDFYASRFTADELNAIAAFQTSATGRKFRHELPEMMAGMAAPMARFQQSLGEEIQKAMKQP